MHPIVSILITRGVFALAGGFLWARKGYNPAFGVVLCALTGPIGLTLSLFLPRTSEAREASDEEHILKLDLKKARQNKTCPDCNCEHSVVNNFCPACMHRYAA